MVRICYTEDEIKQVVKDYWMDEFGSILIRDHHFPKMCELFIERLNTKENMDEVYKMFRWAAEKASEDYAKLNYKSIEKK